MLGPTEHPEHGGAEGGAKGRGAAITPDARSVPGEGGGGVGLLRCCGLRPEMKSYFSNLAYFSKTSLLKKTNKPQVRTEIAQEGERGRKEKAERVSRNPPRTVQAATAGRDEPGEKRAPAPPARQRPRTAADPPPGPARGAGRGARRAAGAPAPAAQPGAPAPPPGEKRPFCTKGERRETVNGGRKGPRTHQA